jgi:hypothetical protein
MVEYGRKKGTSKHIACLFTALKDTLTAATEVAM